MIATEDDNTALVRCQCGCETALSVSAWQRIERRSCEQCARKLPFVGAAQPIEMTVWISPLTGKVLRLNVDEILVVGSFTGGAKLEDLGLVEGQLTGLGFLLDKRLQQEFRSLPDTPAIEAASILRTTRSYGWRPLCGFGDLIQAYSMGRLFSGHLLSGKRRLELQPGAPGYIWTEHGLLLAG